MEYYSFRNRYCKAEFKNCSRNANKKYDERLQRVSLVSVRLPYI